MEEKIISPSNPRIKNVLKLKEKSSERKQQDLIVVEGLREIRMAKENGFELKTLFVCDDIAGKKSKELVASAHHLVRISKDVFEKISYRENSDGLLALVKPKHIRLKDLKLSATPLLIVLEAVEKPGNLGAVLRTADACGADVVIICDAKTDVFNPNVIRSGIGCVFSKQVVAASSAEVIQFLKEKKIRAFAASLTAKRNYTESDLTVPSAIVLGTEADGLSKIWLSSADEQIKIPMLGKTDSLNVSASCAVIAYEAVRQRKDRFLFS
ncbi:MAG: RNA methyltransferase [Bacteroidetes bacterium]|nr:MAG: RNA methyltransferase [Bacteroidota bacterium]